MNRILITLAIPFLLSACASSPTQIAAQQHEKYENSLPQVDMRFLSNAEVTNAVQECQANNEKPLIQYGIARVNSSYQNIRLPINVLCEPKTGLFGLW